MGKTENILIWGLLNSNLQEQGNRKGRSEEKGISLSQAEKGEMMKHSWIILSFHLPAGVPAVVEGLWSLPQVGSSVLPFLEVFPVPIPDFMLEATSSSSWQSEHQDSCG